jgi:nitroreductase
MSDCPLRPSASVAQVRSFEPRRSSPSQPEPLTIEAVASSDAREFVTLLRGLRAVRQFTDNALPPEAVRDILDVIRWSGNASNRQEFQVLWIEDRTTLQRLSELKGYAKHLAGAVIVTWMERDELNAFDEGRIAERIMLAAHAHGIGSSIGWLRDEGREAAKALLGVPADRTVQTTISLGYPAEGSLHGGRRKPLTELVMSGDQAGSESPG